MKLAKRLDHFGEYIFSTLAKKKREVDLSIGSPDIPPSAKYMNKLKQFLAEQDSHMYPGYGAIPEFSKALKDWYKKRFGVLISEDELLPLLGAKDGISHLPLALLDKDDELLVPDPGYPGFFGTALMIGAKPVAYSLTEKNNFKIDFKELEKRITSKTKFMWINFPSNPTGQVINVKEMKTIVDFAKKHKIWLIYDNAYSEITFNGFIAPSILEIKGAIDISVEIGSFSKTFSFAGFRMGWIIGNKSVIQALAKIKSQFDSGLSRPLQQLGAYALNHFDEEWHRNMIKNYEKRRDRIIAFLEKLGMHPKKAKGSLYIWAKIPDDFRNSEVFALDLLKKRHILVTPGTAFGKNGSRYIRVSICANMDNL